MNDLEKDYLKNESGGKNAIKGYNFQSYAGIYYMLVLYKNNKSFKIGFEKADDIEILLDNMKYKIQVKSSKNGLTLSKILKLSGKEKLSIFQKLILDKTYDCYKICFPIKGFSNFEKLKKCGNLGIGEECRYIEENSEILKLLQGKNIDIKKILLQELPFSEKHDYAKKYILGLVKSDIKKIEFDNESFDSLVGVIYQYSAIENDENQYIDNTYFEKIENQNLLQKEIEKNLNFIEDATNSIIKSKYHKSVIEIKSRREIYEEKFKNIELSEIGEKKFYDYLKKEIERIKLLIKEDEYILGAYIIIKYSEKVIAIWK